MQILIKVRFLFFFIVVSFSLLIIKSDASNPEIQFYTTKLVDGIELKTDKFGCHDSIYIYLKIHKNLLDEDSIKFKWTYPSGKTKTKSRQIKLINNEYLFAWDGIKFTNDQNVFLNFIDPSSGFEKYIGNWSVKALLDKPTELRFNVLC